MYVSSKTLANKYSTAQQFVQILRVHASKSAHLKRFQLSKTEWDLLDKLFPLLEVFLIATKQISQSKTPLVHEVIPIFNIITQALNEHLEDLTLLPAICVAAAQGHTMLNKYYGLTDDSIIYRIAMRQCFILDTSPLPQGGVALRVDHHSQISFVK
ncbi:hypothetical protein PILCRDRAFT_91482 [Piloderma croceum F 1598]|uniref:Uncharacterized protein n=1 Tax=Piloderma croceum (strain F 1598) TaxID=765440 RepID=A0A0C3ARZ4_PILCF|nr:hypothetical protein PILCRDRAFT_91482 [Piloderma croceum F 1598]